MQHKKRVSYPAMSDQTPKKRRKIDWDAVQRDYRTGKFTLRELAAKHDVSHVAIANQAKKNGWTQDLGEHIRQATNAKLTEALVNNEVNVGVQAVNEIVQVAAEINKQVILGHREDLKASRKIANALLNELASAALLAEDQELLAQVLAGSGAEPVDEARARTAVSKALSVSSRIKSVKDLADAFTKIHDGERRAFNIKDETGPTEVDPLTALLTRISSQTTSAFKPVREDE